MEKITISTEDFGAKCPLVVNNGFKYSTSFLGKFLFGRSINVTGNVEESVKDKNPEELSRYLRRQNPKWRSAEVMNQVCQNCQFYVGNGGNCNPSPNRTGEGIASVTANLQ